MKLFVWKSAFPQSHVNRFMPSPRPMTRRLCRTGQKRSQEELPLARGQGKSYTTSKKGAMQAQEGLEELLHVQGQEGWL